MSFRVKVLYFGRARDLAGVKEEEYSLPGGSDLDSLLERAEKAHPDLAAFIESMQFALNEEIVTGERDLKDGDSVAVLPPVAGG